MPDEVAYLTTKGVAWVHYDKQENVESNGVAMVGIPVTLEQEAATTIWIGADEGSDEVEEELDYWLGLRDAKRVGLSSSGS